MSTQIENKAIPNTPRSKNYAKGSVITINNSSASPVVNPSDKSVEIIPEGSSAEASDKNVYSALYVLMRFLQKKQLIKSGEDTEFSDDNLLSALRTVSEFIRKNKNDETNGIINFIRGIKINDVPFTSLILKEDETDVSDSAVFSSLRVLSEITANNEDLKKLFLRKDVSDETQGHLTIQGGATLNGLLYANKLINANSGIVAKSNQTSKEISNAVVEETDVEMTSLSKAILEDSSNTVHRFVDLSDVDSSFDSAENGSYLLNKQDGVFCAERYYPETISPITINLHNSDSALWSILYNNKGRVFNGVVGDEIYNLQVNWNPLDERVEIARNEEMNMEIIILTKNPDGSISREEEFIEYVYN